MSYFGPAHVFNFCRGETAELSRRERVEEYNRVKHIADLLGVSASWVRTAERLDYKFEEMKQAADAGKEEANLEADTAAEAGMAQLFSPAERALKAVVPPARRAK